MGPILERARHKNYANAEKGLQVACHLCYVEAARLKAVRQWAETHSPELLAKMNESAKRSLEELRKLIEEAYGKVS